jgi:hypothetical protein
LTWPNTLRIRLLHSAARFDIGAAPTLDDKRASSRPCLLAYRSDLWHWLEVIHGIWEKDIKTLVDQAIRVMQELKEEMELVQAEVAKNWQSAKTEQRHQMLHDILAKCFDPDNKKMLDKEVELRRMGALIRLHAARRFVTEVQAFVNALNEA